MAIFAVSFLPQLAAGKSAARVDKGEGDASMESGGWTEGVFHHLGWVTGRPQAHDYSGLDDKLVMELTVISFN